MKWWCPPVLVALLAFRVWAPPATAELPFDRGEAIDLDRVIPANERGILCLTIDDQGKVYGGTTGRSAHLFMYDPATDKAHDLAQIDGGVGFSYALVRLPDGSLIGGTQADPTGTAYFIDRTAVGKLYRFTPVGTGPAKVEDLGMVIRGQEVYTLAYDPKTNTVVGNTWPDGHFFSYDVAARKVTDHGAIAGHRTYEGPREAEDLNRGVKIKTHYPRQVSRAIVVDGAGGAYTGGADGWLYRYDFQARKLGKLDVRLPAVPGREPWASLDSGVVYPNSGRREGDYTTLIGGTSDGYLLELRLLGDGKHMLRPRGRPFAQGHFQGMVIREERRGTGKGGGKGKGDGSGGGKGDGSGGGKGKDEAGGHFVFGVIGGKEGMPRCFSFSHGGGSSAVIPGGIPQVDGALSMVGFGALVADGKGNIYAGERDRIARLVRFPLQPGAPRKKAAPTPAAPKSAGDPEQGLTKLPGWVVFAPEGTTTDGSGYTALSVGLDGKVYVGASRYGGYAWLLRFDPNTRSYFMERLVNVQDLTGERLKGISTQGKIHAIILIGPDGRVWFATKQAHEIFGTRPEYSEDPEGYPGGHLCYYDPKTGFSRSMGILKRQEGLMGGSMDKTRNILYYRTEPMNHFLVYDVKNGSVQDRGHVGHNCRYMAIDKDGAVYQPGRGNYLSRYDPKTGYVEDLAVKVQGEGYYSAPYVIAVGPNGKLYGAGVSHPWIMEFDIAGYKPGRFPEVTIRNVAPAAPGGLPVQDIHAGVFGKDGKFYYPLATTGPTTKGGKAEQHLRIMRFDPTTGKSETVGIPDTSSLDESKVQHAYVNAKAKYKMDYIQGMAVDADGTLFVMDIYPQLNVVSFPKLTAPR